MTPHIPIQSQASSRPSSRSLRNALSVLAAFVFMLGLVPLDIHAAPTTKGTTGLFKTQAAESLPRGKFNIGIYADKYDRRVLFSGAAVNNNFDPNLLATTAGRDRSLAVDHWHYSLSAGYGILDWLEVGIQVPYTFNIADKRFQGFDIRPYRWANAQSDEYNESGIGDPRLNVKATFINNREAGFFVSTLTDIKFGLADEEKGLGTGAFDVGAGLALTKKWNRIGIHANAMYYFVGEPDDSETNDAVEMENYVYGSVGLNFCPIGSWRNFQVIFETEGHGNSYENETLDANYADDVISSVLGFRYFFTPKGVTSSEMAEKYHLSVGAGVRYAWLEDEVPARPSGREDRGSDNQVGMVAHVAFSPRVMTDTCEFVPRVKRDPVPQPPSVTVTADPASFTIMSEKINEDGLILDDLGDVNAVVSRIRAVARDRDTEEEDLTYAWTYYFEDINAAVELVDGNGDPITESEFDYFFDEPRDQTFVVTVTDPEGNTATAETTVTFGIVEPATPFLALPIIYFDFDRSEIREVHQRDLQEVARLMREEYLELTIILEGYTCPIGTTEYNLALGERRANAVFEYLQALGVPSLRMDRVSYGEEDQYLVVECTAADCNDQRGELAPNRRTEIKVTGGIPEGVELAPGNQPGAVGGEMRDNVQ